MIEGGVGMLEEGGGGGSRGNAGKPFRCRGGAHALEDEYNLSAQMLLRTPGEVRQRVAGGGSNNVANSETAVRLWGEE